jgi:hypothetical protein
MDTSHCVKFNGLTLLYAGISPKKPPIVGNPSKQNLRKRIRYHYRGNAAGSTLRLTLGSLLAEKLDIQLRRVGSGHRLTFATGEHVLSTWMAENALVCWCPTEEPWVAEEEMIARVDLPLNLDQNSHHSFHAFLTKSRARQRETAQALPVI